MQSLVAGWLADGYEMHASGKCSLPETGLLSEARFLKRQSRIRDRVEICYISDIKDVLDLALVQ